MKAATNDGFSKMPKCSYLPHKRKQRGMMFSTQNQTKLIEYCNDINSTINIEAVRYCWDQYMHK